MFGSKFKEKKLKTNLALVVSRLKLLSEKKREKSNKTHREIVDYVRHKRLGGARVRAEHAIKDDFMIEAFEIVELYADLLAARIGLVKQSQTVNEAIRTAVATLIWATPKLEEYSMELRVVQDQLRACYGKSFVEACHDNRFQSVCNRLITKLDVSPPSKYLVEKYLVDVCKSAGVDYQPDECLGAEPGDKKTSSNASKCCENSLNCVSGCFALPSAEKRNSYKSHLNSLPPYSETDPDRSFNRFQPPYKSQCAPSSSQESLENLNPTLRLPTYDECTGSNHDEHQGFKAREGRAHSPPIIFSQPNLSSPSKTHHSSAENDLDQLTERLKNLS